MRDLLLIELASYHQLTKKISVSKIHPNFKSEIMSSPYPTSLNATLTCNGFDVCIQGIIGGVGVLLILTVLLVVIMVPVTIVVYKKKKKARRTFPTLFLNFSD